MPPGGAPGASRGRCCLAHPRSFSPPPGLPGCHPFTLEAFSRDSSRLALRKMLGFLQRPVVVTADVNLNVVALTAVGLLSRLWRLAYPRAVV